MVSDIERSYTGTNIAVVVMAVLVAMVVGYFVASEVKSMRDEGAFGITQHHIEPTP